MKNTLTKTKLTQKQAKTIANNMFLHLQKSLPLLADGLPYVIEVNAVKDNKNKCFDFSIYVENDLNGNCIKLLFSDVESFGVMNFRNNGKCDSQFICSPFTNKDFLDKFSEKITDFI